MRKNAGKILVTIAVMVFALVAWAGWSIWTTSNATSALMAAGSVEVVGKVVALEVEQSVPPITTRTAPKPSFNYYADVSFQDGEGQFQRVRTAISQFDYGRLRVEQDLRLRYAVADPRVVELHEGDLASGSNAGFWMMVCGLAGIGIAVAVYRRNRKPTVI
jgi:hypothetical protein